MQNWGPTQGPPPGSYPPPYPAPGVNPQQFPPGYNPYMNAQMQSNGQPPTAPPMMMMQPPPPPYQSYPQQQQPQYNQMGWQQNQYNQARSNEYSGNFAAEGFKNQSLRKAFVTKVYMILTTQLILTGIPIAISLLYPSMCLWMRRHSYLMWVAIGLFLVTYIALACCESVRRNYPGNFIALLFFTLAMSYMCTTITCQYKTYSILTALVITAAGCLVVTLFAISGCIDFTKCWMLMFVLGIGLMMFAIACSIVYLVYGPVRILETVYGCVAGVVFMLYLAFDTQMIVGGFSHEMSPEEYIMGALTLYLDIVNLFLIMLNLIGDRE